MSCLVHGLETCDVLYVLKQSDDKEVCNYGSGSEIDASDSDDSISCVIKQV
jgi:hypothetical protein